MSSDGLDAPRRWVVALLVCAAGAATGCARTEMAASRASASGERVENFALLDHLGGFHELYYYADAAAIVLFVQGNDCPIVRDSLPALRRAATRFADVAFLMLNANPQDDRESIAREARDYGIELPVLIDETQRIAASLDVTRTAEALVVDPSSWRIVYRGPIDDRRGYGTRHPEASRRYLEEALAAVRAGEIPAIEAPPVQGCLITRLAGGHGRTEPISYAEEVAPILERRCVPCHREGGIAPWAMDGYESVRGWSAMMREVIRTKRMPPWHADPHVGRFANDRSLGAEEAGVLLRWIESGAPRGEGQDPLRSSAAPPLADWPLGPPDLVLEGAPQRVRATGIVPYRYVTLESPLEEGVWVRAAHLRPSNARVLHHALVFVQSPSEPAMTAENPLAEVNDPAGERGGRRRGVPFFRRIFTKYNPGLHGDVFPRGTARYLPAGARFRLQLHYTPTGRDEVDVPSLALYFADGPPRHELKITAATNTRFRIPPRAKRHEVLADHRFERDVVLYSMQPHMHYRGRQMSFEAEFPDGTSELLLSVPNYDFDFQTFYELAEPRRLPAGTRIVCRAVFDNSEQNEANPDPDRRVGWGLQTTDEMLIGYLVYTEPGSQVVDGGSAAGG